MSEGPVDWVERFLAVDPRDSGCESAAAVMHVYAEILIRGENPEERYPGIAAHLAACDSCADDVHGIVEAARNEFPYRG